MLKNNRTKKRFTSQGALRMILKKENSSEDEGRATEKIVEEQVSGVEKLIHFDIENDLLPHIDLLADQNFHSITDFSSLNAFISSELSEANISCTNRRQFLNSTMKLSSLNTNNPEKIDNDATATSGSTSISSYSKMDSCQTKSDAENEDYVPSDEESSDRETLLKTLNIVLMKVRQL